MQNTITQEKTGYEMAVEYAAGVIDDLLTLDAIAENWDLVRNYVDAVDGDEDAETLSELRDDFEAAFGLDIFELEHVQALVRSSGLDDRSEFLDAWLDDVLDVEVRGTYDVGRGVWEVDAVAFLLTAGGPTARVIWDGSSTLAVECSWWSETVVRRVSCDAVAVLAEELADSI